MKTKFPFSHLIHDSNRSYDVAGSGDICREIRIDRFRAAQWLAFFEQQLAFNHLHGPTAWRIYEELESAAWLARWKRDEVVFDVKPCEIAELLEQLSHLNLPSSDPTSHVPADLISCLSRP